MFKLLFAIGVLMFTFEHPLFVGLSCVIYLMSQQLNQEEIDMLKDYISKGSEWLKQLNSLSKTKGLTMKEGREVASDLITNTFNNLNTSQLKSFIKDDVLKDKLNRFVIDEINKEEAAVEEWQAFPLADSDLLDEEEVNFITYLSPDFEWDSLYTHKEHRRLFKLIKSKFRNQDGTIKDEKGNNAAIEIERWIYSFMTQTECEGYGENDEVMEYLIKEEYKNETVV